MTETRTQSSEKSDERPVIHRVCEACNNMFATRAGEKSFRCPNCTKDHKE